MNLREATDAVERFSDWSFADKIKFFAWYLHSYREKEDFDTGDIRGCFDELNLAPPSAIGPFMTSMIRKKPPEALKGVHGFRLEARIRQKFDEVYGQRAATIQIHKILSELPARIPTVDEQRYLQEVLVCFKHKAFRAAVVMCWNLTFDHLCQIVLAKHLPAFNSQLPKSYPRASIVAVAKRDDLSELKESQVLLVCKSAGIIPDGMYKILKEKLDRRNIAAHPSGLSTTEPTAEEFIKDLTENVVLKLK